MVREKTIAPYGTWESPITSDTIAGGSVVFKEVHVNQATGQIYLLEGRPTEGGRSVIVEINEVGSRDILPGQYNATTKVHEYGGGAVAVSSDGSVIFNDANTNAVFSILPSDAILEVLKRDSKLRYADFGVHPTAPNLMLAVQEDHSIGEGKPDEVINTIVLIDSSSKVTQTVVAGADFYSHPKFSPDGKYMSWSQWNHPDMPWTGSQVFVADWKDGEVLNEQYIAGKARKQSVGQPRWHFDGSLLFLDDKTGFWQLYRYDTTSKKTEHVYLDGFEDAELGLKDGSLGNSTFTSLNKDELVIIYTKNAINGILLYNITSKTLVELDLGLIDLSAIAKGSVRRVSDTKFVAIAGTATSPIGLYTVDTTKPTEKRLLKSSASLTVDESFFSAARSISFPRTEGKDQNGLAHAMFIPPQNPNFSAPENSKPPLIIYIHGGPTLHIGPGLVLQAQYFTTRGYAYCYVNHRGSTGYGREYREELDYSWGVKDGEDTVSCIKYLSLQGLVDGTKVGITGRSAGGYATLQGLSTYPDVFAAGCSLFGVGNMKSLGLETHKFESYYLFALLFPEDTPEAEKEKIYKDRSPALNAEKIVKPLVLLQGDADRVVPMGQAVEMEKILREGGKDVKLVIFEGEGHGFLKQEHVKRAVEEEEALWRRTLL